jgi:hypothetical protein
MLLGADEDDHWRASGRMLPLIIIWHNLRQAAGFSAGQGNRVMSGKKLADRLDWNSMLGFEQIVDNRESLGMADQDRLGAKTGGKPAEGIGTKTGGKPVMIGTKTGGKPITRTIMIGTKTGSKPTPFIGAKTGVKPINNVTGA